MKRNIIITAVIVVLLSLGVALAGSLFTKNSEIYNINEEISMLESQMIFNSQIRDDLEIERKSIVEKQYEMEKANSELREIKKSLEDKKKELGLK